MITLTPKDEDYLETIYRISRDSDTVGVTDIARARNVTVPTARSAVSRLIRYGLVRQQHYGKIMLNSDGEKLGEQIYSVHSTIRRFLAEVLLLDAEKADEEACRMEHGLSRSTLRRLSLFLDAVNGCGGGNPGCLGRYRQSIGSK
ncbi:MAG: metal-dependent transcriptional regulator [bacterium]|nr:metal-dependent transcriptional regulator [bacterium]